MSSERFPLKTPCRKPRAVTFSPWFLTVNSLRTKILCVRARPPRPWAHGRVMQTTDPFSGRPTRLTGARLPAAEGWAAVLDGHRQRLRALEQLGEKAAQCGIRADQDRALVLVREDEVSLLEATGGPWAALGDAIRAFRAQLPVIPFDTFGFSSEVDDPFEVDSAKLRRIGGGVEALAFAAGDGSVYKFFLFREGDLKSVV